MSKRIPFDLDRMIAGDPICDAEGTPAIQSTYFAAAGEIVVLFRGWSTVRVMDRTGALKSNPGLQILFMAPKTSEVWVNLYPNTAFVHGEFYGYESEGQADRADVSGGKRLGNCAHKITITE